MEQNNVIKNQEVDEKEKKKSKVNIFGIIAIILSLIPVILFLYCSMVSAGSANENSSGGAIGWLIIIYYWSIGIPIFIASIVLGIVGLNNENKVTSIISFIINGLKILVILNMFFG